MRIAHVKSLTHFVRSSTRQRPALRAKQKVGKYRIEGKIASGGFGTVYRAFDTVEGVRVALKVPHLHLVNQTLLDTFRSEVRLAAKLDHPNILPIKNAEFVGDHFVIAFALGERTLQDRLQRHLALRSIFAYSEQMIEAVAHAHRKHVIHCDIKPENFILFPGDRLRLADFGIARVVMRTIRGSGSGTIGYIAPEQAMGRPSYQSDVFSLGLILYRMLTGYLPEWPFAWPPPGIDKLKRRVPEEFVDFLRRSLDVNSRERFRDADQMLKAFRRVRSKALRFATLQRKRPENGRVDWQTVRRKQFQHTHGQELETRHACEKCAGPVSEAMCACPWCGDDRTNFTGETGFPAKCPRCHRGLKLDWAYCPWCFGPGFATDGCRHYSDRRYVARCSNAACSRKDLMPFMRYCPWCHRKVRRTWKVKGSKDKCSSCGWSILPGFWDYCPWCSKPIERR